MKRLLFFIAIIFLSGQAMAQQARKDSFLYINPEPFKQINYEKLAAEKKKKEASKAPVYTWLQNKYAEKMNVGPAEIKNLALYNFIEEWYGTRYVYGGTTKRGIDCSAFVQKMTDCVLGKSMVRTAASQKQTTESIAKTDLSEGDLVFFSINTKRISHVGVYLQNGYFVHAASSKGVMISSLNDNYWSRYYAGAGRIKFENAEEVGVK